MRDGVDSATALADDETKKVASRVTLAAEPAVRLVLLAAIADAADEIDDQLSTADVSMTLADGNPAFLIDEHGITVEQLAAYDTEGSDEHDETLADDEEDDESLVRFSLRLPKWAKDKVDRRAERQGMSTNAFLTELIVSHLASGRGRRGGPGFGPGGAGGPEFGNRQGDFGPGPGFASGGPGFLTPEVALQLGRMFARGFGEPGQRPGPEGRGRPGGHGPGRGRRRHRPGGHRHADDGGLEADDAGPDEA